VVAGLGDSESRSGSTAAWAEASNLGGGGTLVLRRVRPGEEVPSEKQKCHGYSIGPLHEYSTTLLCSKEYNDLIQCR
jgi:hypothetical protein